MSEQKRVLIITYYWPPSAGSGVQRWLKFVKYLPSSGWTPYIFTPSNPTFPLQDSSLLESVPPEAQVIRYPIWEPYNVFGTISRAFGRKEVLTQADASGKHKSFFGKVTTWIRGNMFVPDPRVFWVRPAAAFLETFLADNNINTIVTTGPPHSMHLIGLRLKKRNPGIRWIADFRDPWSAWGLLDSLKVSEPIRKWHRKLEREVLTKADEVITITPYYVRHFEQLSGRNVHLLTNGYDEDDFRNLRVSRNEKFILRHVGIVNEKCDPRPLMRVIDTLIREDPKMAEDLRLEFIGEVNSVFRNDLKSLDALNARTVFTRTLPHKQLIDLYGSSSLLILVLFGYKDSEGYMPGKLYEYIATGLPVLGVGPEAGDAAALLKESGAGEMISETDADRMKAFIRSVYLRWKRNEPLARGSANTGKLSRRSITGSLVKLFR